MIETWIDEESGLEWYLYKDETLYTFKCLPLFEDEMEGFHVASIKELMTLLDYSKDNYDNGVFKEGVPFKSDIFWASNGCPNSDEIGWSIDINDGRVYKAGNMNKRRVMVVK
jgi:hypothetical protein